MPKQLIKPWHLRPGDTVATVSLSGGAAGDPDLQPWYRQGKNRLRELYGLNVIEARHSLEGRSALYRNPRARAEDLMESLGDPCVKGIFLNQGGDDAIRLLPYIDFSVIHSNPKIFVGFSDATVIHYMFHRASVVSFYGPNVLTTLSEAVALHPYTIRQMQKALFTNAPLGVIPPAAVRIYGQPDWENGLNRHRPLTPTQGYELLQGTGVARGHLHGGSLAPLVLMLKGTELFPSPAEFEGCILFLDCMTPYGSALAVKHMLRGLATTGVFKKASGILVSGSAFQADDDGIKNTILQVVRDEEGRSEIPILYNADFGHTPPMATLPIGVQAEIDCENLAFNVLEPGTF